MSETPQNLADAWPKNYDHLDVEPRWVKTWNDWKIHEYNAESAAAKAGKTFAIDTPPPRPWKTASTPPITPLL